MSSPQASVKIHLETLDNYHRAQEFYSSVGYLQPINPDDIVITAYIEDKIVGVVRLANEKNVVVLRGMMISPLHQRKGFGSQMLHVLQRYIGPQDCYCLPHGWLEEFYGQIGFETISDDEGPPHLQVRLTEGRKKYPKLIIMKRNRK